eukprot:COSAG06_NODE_1463_length_9379_cov_25.004849_6_plen_68_part_00
MNRLCCAVLCCAVLCFCCASALPFPALAMRLRQALALHTIGFAMPIEPVCVDYFVAVAVWSDLERRV